MAGPLNPVTIVGTTSGGVLVPVAVNSSGEFVYSDDVNGATKIATSVAVELTRTADTNAYAIGDQIASTITAGSVTPLQFTAGRIVGGTGRIIGARLVVDSATAFGAIRLHLFNTTPFAAAGFQGDNAAIALTYTALKTGSAGTNPNYIGYIDFQTFVAQSASAQSNGVCDLTELAFVCAAASQVIFGLLEARAAFTPASGEKFNVTLDIIQD
jgi:hypothetical protein